MHIKSISMRDFKRFTDTTVDGLPASARLVVLTGPNGSGKSAIFEAFNHWKRTISGWGAPNDPAYFAKRTDQAEATQAPAHQIDVQFHEEQLGDQTARRKIFYIRSAYRHDPDFQSDGIRRQQPIFDNPGHDKLIQVEQKVKENYERLASLTVKEAYSPANDNITVKELRERLIGKLQEAMKAVFEDLVLEGTKDPIDDGTFFFTKGVAHGFHFKNLSGGEKAAFDLLLDYVVHIEAFDNSIFCIDEPELHMGSRVQARLLDELLKLLPANCQLWIATHSLGMMREALRQYQLAPTEVTFLDTYGLDFDQAQHLTPRTPDRAFWKQVLEVALDDIATLVGPEQVVLCESDNNFDRNIYSTIFSGTKPNVEFISVGNSQQVQQGGGGAASAIEVVAPGTTLTRLIDRDDLTEEQVIALRTNGVRVLERRSIEGYLLSDEILQRLCEDLGHSNQSGNLIAARDAAIAGSRARRQTPADDFKVAGNEVRVFARQHLGLTRGGNTTEVFQQSFLAPLVTPETETYRELERIIFQ